MPPTLSYRSHPQLYMKKISVLLILVQVRLTETRIVGYNDVTGAQFDEELLHEFQGCMY